MVVTLGRVTVVLLLVLQSALFVLPSMAADSGTFTLTVKLQDAYNSDIEFETDLVINKPFRIMKRNGAVDNTISGVLYLGQGSKYRLRLNILEWQSKTQNSNETYVPDLELGKPWNGGAIQSSVLLRTVILSRQKK